MYFKKKRKMTKKTALEICEKLWLWLADNPKCYKYDWPLLNRVENIFGYMSSHCPCCAYAEQVHDQVDTYDGQHKCDSCPLLGYAWFDNGEQSAWYCTQTNSPYVQWEESQDRLIRRSAGALRIVAATRQALDDLKNGTDTRRKEVSNG